MRKIQGPLAIVNLKIYFRERAYSMPQIKFLTLMNLKNSRKRPLNILNNLMKKIKIKIKEKHQKKKNK